MLPNTIQTDNKAPQSGWDISPLDTIEYKRNYLKSLIMELTDDECDLLWEKWRTRHV